MDQRRLLQDAVTGHFFTFCRDHSTTVKAVRSLTENKSQEHQSVRRGVPYSVGISLLGKPPAITWLKQIKKKPFKLCILLIIPALTYHHSFHFSVHTHQNTPVLFLVSILFFVLCWGLEVFLFAYQGTHIFSLKYLVTICSHTKISQKSSKRPHFFFSLYFALPQRTIVDLLVAALFRSILTLHCYISFGVIFFFV